MYRLKNNSLLLLLACCLFTQNSCDEVGGGRSLLWEVRNGDNVSWLFGTIHIADPDFKGFSEVLGRAFAGSDLLYTEMVPSPENQVIIMKSMLLPEGEKLQDRIGASQYSRFCKVLVRHNLGVPGPSVNRFKVWAAALLISWPRSRSEVPMDMMIYEKAGVLGLERKGLETPEEQVAAFDSLSERDRLFLFNNALEEAEKDFPSLETVKKAYLEQDIEKLGIMTKLRMPEIPEKSRKHIMHTLLHERNDVFMKKLVPAFRKGGVFAAVGAGHLGGADGLLASLHEEGFELRPVEFGFKSK